MPVSALRPCVHPGCRRVVQRGRCPEHARQREQARPNADTRKWYQAGTWKRLRRLVLSRDPLCVECRRRGEVTLATDVDHIEPHRGEWAKFVDSRNLQGLCHRCHAVKTQAEGTGHYV